MYDRNTLQIKNLEKIRIDICDCDCPYDYGGICKHTAAVLMAIRDGQFQKQTASGSAEQGDFAAVIQQTDAGKLRQFVTEYAEQDETFRNRLMAAFGNLQDDRIFAEIKRKLDKSVRAFQEADYYSENVIGREFSSELDKILSDTEEYAKNGYSVLAFKIAVYVVRSASCIVDELYKYDGVEMK